MQRPANHPATPQPRIGVLLVNLGTPDAPTPVAVRRYLKQFLSDRRVVEIPPLLWQPILRGIILNVRPRKSAAAYAKVWTDRGSPLAMHSADQAEALARRFPDIEVRFAMRYGNPSIAAELKAMKAAGCDRILVAPLYPQYSGATTATVQDETGRALAAMRWQPTVRMLPVYHDDPAYIAALQSNLTAGLASLDFVPDQVIASFHGMPLSTLELGDPYHCQCQKTARLLSEAMGIEFTVAFQSRFGRAQWLGPATDAVIEDAGRNGRKVAIFAPGFAVDCLETLEELAIRGREQFEEAGGKDFAYLSCLNSGEAGMAMLEHLVRRELSGWLPA